MRLAFVTDSYHPTIDGVVSIVDSISKTLREMGHEVFIIAPDPGKDKRMDGVHYFPAIKFKMYEGYFVPIFPSNKIQILEEINPDVIHVYGIALMALKGFISAHTLKKPCVITMTTMVTDAMEFYLPKFLPKDTTEKLAQKYIVGLLNHMDAVVTHTEPVMTEMEMYGMKPRKKRIVPAGIDTNFYRPIEDVSEMKKKLGVEDKKLLVHTGRISYEKHVENIVISLKELDENIHLLLVGDGPARPDIEKIVLENNLQNRVHFTGFVDKEDLPIYYNCADVCISNSRFETQGLSIMEAMACGKPIICPNARAFSVIIENNVDGYLFDEDSELPSKIKEALNATEEFKQNAIKKAKMYSNESCGNALIQLYNEVIEDKKKRLAKQSKE